MSRLKGAGIAAELAPSARSAAGEARRLLRQAESMQARRAAYDYFFHSPPAALPGVDLPVDSSTSRAAALPAWDSFNPLFSDREWRLYAVSDDPGGGGGGGGERRAAEGCWGERRGGGDGRYGKDFREDESSGFGMFSSRNGRSSPSFFSPPRRVLRRLKSREDESSGFGLFSSRKGRSSPSFFSPSRRHDSSACAHHDTENPPKPFSPRPRHSASPPRHSASPPRHSASPPRHSVSPPRHSASPSRHSASPPRHSASPPRHSASPPRHSAGAAHGVPAEPYSFPPPRQSSAGTASEESSSTIFEASQKEPYSVPSPRQSSADTASEEPLSTSHREGGRASSSSVVSTLHRRSSGSPPLLFAQGHGQGQGRNEEILWAHWAHSLVRFLCFGRGYGCAR
ncbi:unnamed protein product [Closterium sp. Naga37s-1]|nr:unnamed protein product [Closterium sp. Naga37s-1]